MKEPRTYAGAALDEQARKMQKQREKEAAKPRELQIWDLPVFGWAWKGDAKDKRA